MGSMSGEDANRRSSQEKPSKRGFCSLWPSMHAQQPPLARPEAAGLCAHGRQVPHSRTSGALPAACPLPARCLPAAEPLPELGPAATALNERPCKQQAPALWFLLLNNLGLLVPFCRLISLLEAVKAKPPNSNNMTTKHF